MNVCLFKANVHPFIGCNRKTNLEVSPFNKAFFPSYFQMLKERTNVTSCKMQVQVID